MSNKIDKKIFILLKEIPKGKVSTYKILAQKIGKPNCFRLIGKILASNRFTKKYPCYKIVKSNGEIGGYNRGEKNKIILLKKDGIEIKKDRIVNFKKHIFKYD